MTVPILGGTSSSRTVVSKTANYTAVDGDIVLADASGGAFTVTLPTATLNSRVTVKKIDKSYNTVTLAPASGTIDGYATVPMTGVSESLEVAANGTNWYIV